VLQPARRAADTYTSVTAPTADYPLVLVVDDDASICAAYQMILGQQAYRVLTAGSRADAMRVIDEMNGQVSVLVLDIGLPDADGGEVAREIHQRIGPRPTLYVSGWTDEFWNLSDAPTPWLVLQKPIPIPRLIGAIDYLAGRRDRPED